jgi:hypothetical protein
MNTIRIHPVSAGLALVGVALLSVARAQQPQQFLRITPEQSEILSHMSIVYLDDGQGGQAKTIRFTGVNVQVVNGLGSTSGTGLPFDFVGATNGVGNLIVGYNEDKAFPSAPPKDRTGSHNLVVGYGHDFTKFGGVLFGRENALHGAYSAVLGGTRNACEAVSCSIVSGYENTMEYGPGATFDSAILGGDRNSILGSQNVIVGGAFNEIVGGNSGASTSVVVGGFDNLVQGAGAGAIGWAVAVGGRSNVVDHNWAAVTGGRGNHAAGDHGVVSGGLGRTVSGSYDWAAGLLFQDE